MNIGDIMEGKKTFLERKAGILKRKLGNSESFTVSNAEEVLRGKKSTLYWILWSLAEKGYIQRIGKGLYSFYKKDRKIHPILSRLAERTWSILSEAGYEFFISGLDILSVFMEHIPETFPVLLFVGQHSKDEIVEELSKNNLNIASDANFSLITRHFSSAKEFVLLYPTVEFTYSENGLASFEKAFVDIYYEVTRNKYPLSIQELARIYINMKRRIPLDTKRLTKIASRRNIHQDIRYIVESRFITEGALKLAEIIHGI